jgi:hypothetical protein
VRRTRESLQQELGRTPTNEEIAGKLDMTVEKFNKMLRLTRRSISLEKPKYNGNPKNLGMDSETTLGDTIDSSSVMHDEQSPEKTVDQNLFQSDIKEMLQVRSTPKMDATNQCRSLPIDSFLVFSLIFISFCLYLFLVYHRFWVKTSVLSLSHDTVWRMVLLEQLPL